MSVGIKFNSVSFAYHKTKPVFIDLLLDLPPDKTVLLTGENGSGKSTLAALAAGILHPQAGSVLIHREDRSVQTQVKPGPEIVLLQQNAADNTLGITPERDLSLWLSNRNLTKSHELKVISDLLQAWDISEQRLNPVWELSSGQLKALALAGISLALDKYWILDEPFVELDEHNLDSLQNLIRQKQSVSRGMLIISHHSELFGNLVDLILELSPQGEIRVQS